MSAVQKMTKCCLASVLLIESSSGEGIVAQDICPRQPKNE